jgi:hypothetical protein
MLIRFCRGTEDCLMDVNIEFIPRIGEVVVLFIDQEKRRFRVYSVEHFLKPNKIGEITHSVGIVVDPL